MTIEEDGVLKRCKYCEMFAKDMERHASLPTCRIRRGRRKNEGKKDAQYEAEDVSYLGDWKKGEESASIQVSRKHLNRYW